LPHTEVPHQTGEALRPQPYVGAIRADIHALNQKADNARLLCGEQRVPQRLQLRERLAGLGLSDVRGLRACRPPRADHHFRLSQQRTNMAGIVRACTDADTLPKPPWRARKEAYIAHLEHADRDTLLVSCADKLHNARAIVGDLRTHGLAVFDRFTGGRAGTIWYYASLAEVFSRRLPSPLSAELELAVGDMQRLAGAGSGA
jgi:hypothetical protein